MSVESQAVMTGNPILAQHFGNVSYESHDLLSYSNHFPTQAQCSHPNSQSHCGPHNSAVQREPSSPLNGSNHSVSSSSTYSDSEKKRGNSIPLHYSAFNEDSNSSMDDDYDAATGFSRFGTTSYRKIVQFVPTGKKNTRGGTFPIRSVAGVSGFTAQDVQEDASSKNGSSSQQVEQNENVEHLDSTFPLPAATLMPQSSRVDAVRDIILSTAQHSVSGGLRASNIPLVFSHPDCKTINITGLSHMIGESKDTGKGNVEPEENECISQGGLTCTCVKTEGTGQQQYVDETPALSSSGSMAVPNLSAQPAVFSSLTNNSTELPLEQLMMHSKTVLKDAKRLCELSRVQGSGVSSPSMGNSFQPPSYQPSTPEGEMRQFQDQNDSGSKGHPVCDPHKKLEEGSARIRQQSGHSNSSLRMGNDLSDLCPCGVSSPSTPSLSAAHLHQLRTAALSVLNDERAKKEASTKEIPPTKIFVSCTNHPIEILEVRARRRWYPPVVPSTAGTGCCSSGTRGCCTGHSPYQMIEVEKQGPPQQKTGPSTPTSCQKEAGMPPFPTSSASKKEKPILLNKASAGTPPVGNMLSVDSLVTIIEKLSTLLHPQPPPPVTVSAKLPLHSKPHQENIIPSGRRPPKSPKVAANTPRGRLVSSKQSVTTPKSNHHSSHSSKILKVHTPVKISSSNSAPTSPFAKSGSTTNHTSGRKPQSSFPSGSSNLALSSKKCSRGLRAGRSGSRVPFYALPTQNWLCKHSKDADVSVGYHSSGSGGSSSSD